MKAKRWRSWILAAAVASAARPCASVGRLKADARERITPEMDAFADSYGSLPSLRDGGQLNAGNCPEDPTACLRNTAMPPPHSGGPGSADNDF